MSTYQITIDQSLCSGFGACVDAAPDLFLLDAAGTASAVELETSNPAALDAAASCPMGAICVTKVLAA
jgi:ferredoxin